MVKVSKAPIGDTTWSCRCLYFYNYPKRRQREDNEVPSQMRVIPGYISLCVLQ